MTLERQQAGYCSRVEWREHTPWGPRLWLRIEVASHGKVLSIGEVDSLPCNTTRTPLAAWGGAECRGQEREGVSERSL